MAARSALKKSRVTLAYAGNIANLDAAKYRSEFRFVQGNILDTQLVQTLLTDERLDTVVHFAAETHVDRSIKVPGDFVQTNVVGTHSLLMAARRVWLDEYNVATHRFHHVSTDEGYGSLAPDEPPFSESRPYAPNSPYSASKAAADLLVRAYSQTYGLRTTISHCSNNYGPYQYPEKLIALMLSQLLQGKLLPLYGDGRNVRDWLHVEDHCRGIESVLLSGRIGAVYNVGGHGEYENIVLVRTLCAAVEQLFDSMPELRRRFPNCPAARGFALISYVQDRPGHDRRYAVDSSRIERECRFVPRVTLESGLRQTVEWYLGRGESECKGQNRSISSR